MATVLLVENDTASGEAIRKNLTESGHSVISFSDIESAALQLSESVPPYDVVVVDLGRHRPSKFLLQCANSNEHKRPLIALSEDASVLRKLQKGHVAHTALRIESDNYSELTEAIDGLVR